MEDWEGSRTLPPTPTPSLSLICYEPLLLVCFPFSLFSKPSFLSSKALKKFLHFRISSKIRGELVTSLGSLWQNWTPASSLILYPFPAPFFKLCPPLSFCTHLCLYSQLHLLLISVGCYLIFWPSYFSFLIFWVLLSFICYIIITILWDFNMQDGHLCNFFLYNPAQKYV